MSDKNIETKEISFEHTCPKCGYNNHTTYNWPVKVYERQDYKFETYCTGCGEKLIHIYTEETEQLEENKENENENN